uniref:Protein kinase domain-containing protein n=1 Tax=Vitis vinifera TaxID=29760 RepID=F6HWD3_VITVI
MAVCNAGIALLHSNTLPLLHIFMVSFFLSLMIPSANSSLSFSFNDFDPNCNQIHFEGQASYSGDKAIYLTRSQQEKKMNDSWGRATYREPFHLWDKASKRMADFSTNFSFGIDSQGKFSYGEGLAFFLAPYGTQLPSDVRGGSGLGLVSNNQQALNSEANHFFAVEFDTYPNDWDPKYDHVELLLVYDFMPNGCLASHLFEGKTLLTWAMRYKIATGLASALLYLHEEWEQCVVHRDVKSSNVILDADFNAKLGDFGLARLVDHGKKSQTTILAGTMGYMAPECLMAGNASKESGVYSFGVVALEICSGRKSVEPKAKENQIKLVEWVWALYGVGKLLEAADPRLSADFDEKQMERLMIVGLWCAHPDCNLRPAIRQAVNGLNYQASLPILPSNMTMPMYYAPRANTYAFSLQACYTATISERG